MSKTCNTDKYRRRRRQEIENRKTRDARLARIRREAQIKYEAIRKEKDEQERRRKLADPRRPYAQRMVNILNAKLQNDPEYRLNAMLSVFGVPPWGSLLESYRTDEGDLHTFMKTRMMGWTAYRQQLAKEGATNVD